jgi:hypothetical protein
LALNHSSKKSLLGKRRATGVINDEDYVESDSVYDEQAANNETISEDSYENIVSDYSSLPPFKVPLKKQACLSSQLLSRLPDEFEINNENFTPYKVPIKYFDPPVKL